MLFLSDKLGLSKFVGPRNGADGDGGGEVVSDAGRRAVGASRSAVDVAASRVGTMADSARSGLRDATSFASEQASNMAEGVRRGAGAVGDTMSNVSESASETARRASRIVTDEVRAVRDQVADTTEPLARVAQGAAETVQEYSSTVAGQVADTAARVRRQTTDTARKVKSTTMSLIQEQPLLCAAVGLAVGAAIAAILPSTETEDELLGETSDGVKAKMGEVASEQFEAAKAAAGKAAQAAGTVALREGLNGSGAADAARGLGEKLKRVVTEAATAAASEVRSRTGLDGEN